MATVMGLGMDTVTIGVSDSGDVVELLARFVRGRGWWAYYYGGRKTPRLIAYTRLWRRDGVADVVILRGEDQAAAYRTYWELSTNVLKPDLVYWYYESTAKHTLRAILALPPPSDPAAPFGMYSPPRSCGVDDDERPIVVRPTRIV